MQITYITYIRYETTMLCNLLFIGNYNYWWLELIILTCPHLLPFFPVLNKVGLQAAYTHNLSKYIPGFLLPIAIMDVKLNWLNGTLYEISDKLL